MHYINSMLSKESAPPRTENPITWRKPKMLKTSTTIKLRYAQKFLKTAHEAMVEAIVANPEFAAYAMENPKDSNVTMLITALLKTNSAGKDLQNLIALHG